MIHRYIEGDIISRKILVVDDEEYVRKGLVWMIEWMGFEVLATDCGKKAVKLFEENIFDVVFTDYNMPGMNGSDLARCIKEISPKTPIILITGDPEELSKNRPGGDSIDMVVPKPCKLKQIEESIGRMLREKSNVDLGLGRSE
ncbi:response regulator [Thermodesulfobacteriota bacterium]